jgi:hypothetical protein
MKPSNWDLPKRCDKFSFIYDGKEYKQERCLHDDCPLRKWLPPKKVFDSASNTLKFKWLVGKCMLNVSESNVTDTNIK